MVASPTPPYLKGASMSSRILLSPSFFFSSKHMQPNKDTTWASRQQGILTGLENLSVETNFAATPAASTTSSSSSSPHLFGSEIIEDSVEHKLSGHQLIHSVDLTGNTTLNVMKKPKKKEEEGAWSLVVTLVS